MRAMDMMTMKRILLFMVMFAGLAYGRDPFMGPRLAVWDGVGKSGGVVATGGTVTNYTDGGGISWTAHIFTDVGTNTLTVTSGGEVEYLVVGGGGGGGASYFDGGGGGGAGGVITGNTTVENSTITVVVGNYGTAGTKADRVGKSGFDSVFGSITAYGGGGGGQGIGTNGLNGGSGGGGGGSRPAGNNVAGGSGTLGQGNSGGSGFGANDTQPRQMAAGGGGGAGAVGTSGAAFTGGSGGDGIASSITGVSTYYGGGGGGGTREGKIRSSGGLGGGGGGGCYVAWEGIGFPGVLNTGGGGGGGGGPYNLDIADGINRSQGSRGGSGIVVVRYRTN